MQLIPGGPDIPAAVIQALEDDRLVFFCGAGVSKGAGLPLFRGLVDRVFEHINEPMQKLEEEAYSAGAYDRSLHLLERRLAQPKSVREAVADILDASGKLRSPIHESLLHLAVHPDRTSARLVTTNFDRLFEPAAKASAVGLTIDTAPKLPVPKPFKWSSLVYLHGRVGDTPDNRSLVLTSADFGTAYLTEGWAARFVRDLFAHYTVLFVGYSAEDPVVRYLLDALAAERDRAANFQETFALVPTGETSSESTIRRWKAKGVEPIPYDDRDKHRLLSETSGKWAELWRGGIGSRQSIAQSCGRAAPATLPAEEKSMFLWAIAHRAGLEAFCSLETDAPLAWLEQLEKIELGIDGEAPSRPSITTRGSSLNRAGYMVARWAASHIESPDLLEFVISRRGLLHPDFQRLVQDKLACAKLSAGARGLWRLLCIPTERTDPFPDLPDENDQDAPAQLLRLTLPVLHWDPWSMRASALLSTDTEPTRACQLATVEIGLYAGQQSEELMHRFATWSQGQKAALCLGLTGRVAEVLELFRIAGMADESRDPSLVQRQSITPSAHNFSHPRWTILVDLIRESFMALDATDPEAARAMVGVWRNTPFPLFRRLALDAVAHSSAWTATEKLDLLLGDEKHHAFWALSTKREVAVLLAKLWPDLSPAQQDEVVAHAFRGPPRKICGYLSPSEVDDEIRRLTAMRLRQIANLGASLPEQAADLLAEVESHTRFATEQLQGFSSWRGELDIRPDKTAEEMELLSDADLLAVLTKEQWVPQKEATFDEWGKLCAKQPRRAFRFLKKNRAEPIAGELLSRALGVLSNRSLPPGIQQLVGSYVSTAPPKTIEAAISSASWFFKQQAVSWSTADADAFWKTWRKLERIARNEPAQEAQQDWLSVGQNHPLGRLVGAAAAVVETEQKLLPIARDALSAVLDGSQGAGLGAGLVIIGEHTALFHDLDQRWTEEHILPLFDWDKNPNAHVVWQGFLHSPWTVALFSTLKKDLSAARAHAARLGPYQDRLGWAIATGSIECHGLLTSPELQQALREMPGEAREGAATWLWSHMNSAPQSRRAFLWQHTVGPWIRDHWPRSSELQSNEASVRLGEAALAAEESFPAAVELLTNTIAAPTKGWILPYQLRDTDLPERFPVASAGLLKWICEEAGKIPELTGLLARILDAHPNEPTAEMKFLSRLAHEGVPA